MRHLNSGRKLQRTSSHRKALLSNMATALIVHKRIETTEAKAKELRPFVEKLITRAKHARKRENEGTLTGGNQTIDIHARRTVAKLIRDKAALEELFDTVADVVESREGGYCRITKLGVRRGDAARMAVIELVDWGEDQDGSVTLRRRRRKQEGGPASAPQEAQVEQSIEDSVSAAIETLESIDQKQEAGAASDDAGDATTVDSAVEPTAEASSESEKGDDDSDTDDSDTKDEPKAGQ